MWDLITVLCGISRFKTCQRIAITGTIHDRHGHPIGLNELSIPECCVCDSVKIVKSDMQICQTRQKLKVRLNQHRSDSNRKADTMAIHFRPKCPNIKILQNTPVEQLIRTIPEAYIFMKLLDKADQVKVFQREQFWIKRLKILIPHELNKRQEPPAPPSIPPPSFFL